LSARPHPCNPPCSRCRVGPACHLSPQPFGHLAELHACPRPGEAGLTPHVPGPRHLTPFFSPSTHLLASLNYHPARSLALPRSCMSFVASHQDELRRVVSCLSSAATAPVTVSASSDVVVASAPGTCRCPRTPPRLSSARGEDRRRPFFPPIHVSLSIIAQFAGEGQWRCFVVVPWSSANSRRPCVLGRRRRRHPSLDAFARLAAPMETRRLADSTLRLTRRRTKAYDEVIPSRGLVHHGGPRVIRPIVAGPAWPLRITGLICKGFPVITVCNPALWEYSGDNLGA
jgi:hypothetical protein